MVAAEASERRFRLTLHYDGERFHGWQVQPSVRTVQGEVEAALARITGGRPVSVIAAGRTDTGVHATGQVVSVAMPARWDRTSLERALNAVLPADVWVAAVDEAPLAFHARFDAVGRAYLYHVGTARSANSPFQRRWCWPLGEAIDFERVCSAAARFRGTHEFSAFARSGQPERGYRCTVFRSEWSEWGASGYEYRVVANRFLHHMVRYMVGTMIDVARGRRPVDDVDMLLGPGTGIVTSPPAPANGLCLVRVYYDETELAPEPESRDLHAAGRGA